MGDVIDVQQCLVEPNNCAFDQPVVITLEFDSKGINDCYWDVQYEADYTNKRHVISLCSVGPSNYAAGHHTVDLKLPPVDTEGVKERRLLSMGILKCILTSNKEEVASVNFVTQVSRGEGGKLLRLMMNPLE
eukprot:TRINITY_DN27586_c0_g1_i1.p1 TRINITY_DN27586_c0_g1~~TRINITY_DN27586_c0_g1_i1.p1  ORF type:complete len:132 (+),score=60.91 TRINITY_DN27586_c0_g1_i1:256-651(+)